MTENEAIKELKEDYNELGKAIPCDTGWGVAINEAYSIAIKALEEIQEYRAIGTVEEFKALKEKNEPKKPIERFTGSEWVCECPACRGITETPQEQIVESIQYCAWCGQKLDWSE